MLGMLLWLACLPVMAGEPQNLWQVYQSAVNSDPTLAAAKSERLAAEEKLAQGRALSRPTVTFSSNASHTESDIQYIGVNIFRNAGRESFNTYGYSLNINQPLFRKLIGVQNAEARIQVSLADKQLALAQQDLMLRAAQVYFDVLLAQDRIGLIQAQKTAISKQLEQAQANFDVGTATITDVNEAKARFDLVQAQEIAAQNDLEVKKYAMQAITGQTAPTLAKVLTEISPAMPEQGDLEGWVQMAEQNNLSLSIQMQELEIATQQVEKQNAGHYPTLDAVGSYADTRADGSVNGFGTDLQNATIGLQLQVPLYQGGAVSSRVREALANKQKAQEELEAVRRKVELATRQSYLNLSSSVAQVKAYEQALRSSQSQLESTQLGYEVGVRTSVDVLNAQQQYFSANRDLLQARYTYLVSLLKLRQSVGLLTEADIQSVNQQLMLANP